MTIFNRVKYYKGVYREELYYKEVIFILIDFIFWDF